MESPLKNGAFLGYMLSCRLVSLSKKSGSGHCPDWRKPPDTIGHLVVGLFPTSRELGECLTMASHKNTTRIQCSPQKIRWASPQTSPEREAGQGCDKGMSSQLDQACQNWRPHQGQTISPRNGPSLYRHKACVFTFLHPRSPNTSKCKCLGTVPSPFSKSVLLQTRTRSVYNSDILKRQCLDYMRLGSLQKTATARPMLRHVYSNFALTWYTVLVCLPLFAATACFEFKG